MNQIIESTINITDEDTVENVTDMEYSNESDEDETSKSNNISSSQYFPECPVHNHHTDNDLPRPGSLDLDLGASSSRQQTLDLWIRGIPPEHSRSRQGRTYSLLSRDGDFNVKRPEIESVSTPEDQETLPNPLALAESTPASRDDPPPGTPIPGDSLESGT